MELTYSCACGAGLELSGDDDQSAVPQGYREPSMGTAVYHKLRWSDENIVS